MNVDEATLKISPLLIPLFSQPVRLGMVSGNMIQDRRDDPVDPRKGIYNTVDIGIADRLFGSQKNFFRFLGRNATYHPINRRLTCRPGHQLRRSEGLSHHRRPSPGHPPAGALLRRRRHLPPRLSRTAGRPARPHHRISPRRHRAAFQPDGVALPVNRRKHRRRTVSRRRQRLLQS